MIWAQTNLETSTWHIQVQVAEQKVKNVLLGATTFFVGFNALAAAPTETKKKTVVLLWIFIFVGVIPVNTDVCLCVYV